MSIDENCQKMTLLHILTKSPKYTIFQKYTKIPQKLVVSEIPQK